MQILTHYIINYCFFKEKGGSEHMNLQKSFECKKNARKHKKMFERNPYVKILSCDRVVEMREPVTL